MHWWKWGIIFGIAACGYWWLANQTEPGQSSVKPSLAPETVRLASELERKHNAVRTWTNELPTSPYSIEMQRALIRKDGRPVLFASRVTDIRQTGKGFQLDMEPLWAGASLRLILDCQEDTINAILSQDPRETNYLAVAQIQSVGKALFRVGAHGEGVDMGDYDDEGNWRPMTGTLTELEIEAGDSFLARGTCVEIQPYRPMKNLGALSDKEK